jgi:autotransporter-associated beta strand protein
MLIHFRQVARRGRGSRYRQAALWAAAALGVAAMDRSTGHAWAAPIQGSWLGGSGSNWSTPANWANGVVPGTGAAPTDDVANFTGTNNAAANAITLDVAVTAGTLNFDRAGGFSIGGFVHPLTLRASTANAAINVTAATGTNAYSIPAGLTLGSELDVSVAAGCTLTVNTISDGKLGKGITLYGAGTMILDNHHTYTGPTRVNGGTLTANLYTNVYPGDVIVGQPGGTNPATLRFSYESQTSPDANVTVNGAGVLDAGTRFEKIGSLAGNGTIKLADTPASVGSFVISGTTSTTFSGTINGFGGIYKTGTSTLTIAGPTHFNPTNDFSSPFELDAGTLVLADDGALGGATLYVKDDTGTASVRAGGGGPRTMSNTVSVNHFLTFDGPNPLTFGSLAINGTVSGRAVPLTVNVDTTFTGQFQGWGYEYVNKMGSATLSLNLDNPANGAGYGREIVVSAGTLRPFGGSVGFSPINKYLISNSTLDLSSVSPNATISPIIGTNSTVIGSFNVQNTINSISGTNLTIIGDITIGIGAGNFLSGTLTTGKISIAGRSSFPYSIYLEVPNRSVFGGTATAVVLADDTNLTVIGALNKPVVAAGLVNGTGTVSGSISLSGGTSRAYLQPGATSTFSLSSPYTLTTGDLAFGDNSGLWELFSGTRCGRVNLTGGVDLGASTNLLKLAGSLGAAPTNTVYTLINNDGADPIIGRFAGLANDGDTIVLHTSTFDYTLAISYHYDAAGDGAANDLALTYLSSVAVPEPSLVAPALAAGALLTTIVRGARRRRATRRWGCFS